MKKPAAQKHQVFDESTPPHQSLFYIIALFIFAIDRVSKYWALNALAKEKWSIFPGLSFDLAFNTGVSFSFFSSSTGQSHWGLTAFVAIIVALMVIIWRYFSSHSLLSDVGYACILGGAVSNFYDRLYFGGVIDFIDVYFRNWHYPTFNVADSAIVIGFLFILWEAYNVVD